MGWVGNCMAIFISFKLEFLQVRVQSVPPFTISINDLQGTDFMSFDMNRPEENF